MDVTTIVAVMSMHLMASGALLVLISRHATKLDGLSWFGTGSAMLGVVCATRLTVDFSAVELTFDHSTLAP